MAKKGDENRFKFPLPLQKSKEVAFSYSGLKNAVRLQIQKSEQSNNLKDDLSDICASFQKTDTEHLTKKTSILLEKTSIKHFAIVGGVSSNQYIRDRFLQICEKYGKTLHLAKSEFCSDNSAMIGRYAIELFHKKQFVHHSKLEVKSRFL
jgi:N6-L-threonylcarbamoyladenine synthase